MNRRKLIAILILCVLSCLGTKELDAHEMRPAFLHIKETSSGQFNILWKIPRIDDKVISLKPQFPDWFEMQQELPAIASGNGALYHYTVNTTKDIHGMNFTIAGIKESMVDVLVQIELLNGEQYTMMLQPAKSKGSIPMKTSAWDTIIGYFTLGVKHIWLGFDHLLFVLALLIITLGNTRRLLITVTFFTIAHSITLSLAALGFLGLPGPPVEATIALSIVFLAVEMVRGLQGVKTLTSQKPWLVAFIFGLLHGLGFASALASIGLPQRNIPLALAAFNVGVEAGQIAFIFLALAIGRLLQMNQRWPVWIQKVLAYCIGSIASFWLIERVISFWN